MRVLKMNNSGLPKYAEQIWNLIEECKEELENEMQKNSL